MAYAGLVRPPAIFGIVYSSLKNQDLKRKILKPRITRIARILILITANKLRSLLWSGVRENCVQPQGMNPLEMTQIA